MHGASVGDTERASNPVRVVVRAVHGRAGLLPPGLIEGPRVDPVEAERVHETDHDGLGPGVIAGDGEGDPALRSLRQAALGEAVGHDVVEDLHDGAA